LQAQRREHLLGKALGQDPRINTNVEILKNIEDKEKDDEENKSS
jgi:predicted transcriptional regulator